MASVCEFHPIYQKQLPNAFVSVHTMPNLRRELKWGVSYRTLKKDNKLATRKSPTDVPFKLCRERQRKKKEIEQQHSKNKSMKTKTKKLSLIEKCLLSQSQYMEYLSTPNLKSVSEPPPAKKAKKECRLEPCSPRLIELAVPNKQRVFSNWKYFYDRLPTEMIVRFEQILQTKNCLKPQEARYYYKNLDKEKKKQLKAKKLQRTAKRRQAEKTERQWVRNQIDQTAEDIVKFVMEEPLFVLNYKQLLVSDGILNQIEKQGMLKKPRRNTKKSFKKTIVEIADKLSIWLDILTRFVDVQLIDSDDEIALVTVSSSEGYDSDQEDVCESCCDDDLYESLHQSSNFLEPGVDLLKKLIRVLAKCSDEFLDGEIDQKQLPNVIYRDILSTLMEIHYELDEKEDGGSFMEHMLISWAMRNEPQAVDLKMLKKIKEVSLLLEEYYRMVEKSAEGKPGKEVDEQVTENQESDEQVTDEKVTDEQVAGEEGPTTADVGESAIAESKDVTTDTKERGEKQRGRMGTQLDLAGFSVPEEEIWGADVPPMWTDKLDQGEEWEAEPESAIEGEGEAEVKPGAAPPVAVIYEKGEVVEEGEEGLLIKGHKPSVIMEHTPNTVCCLSLKIWAVWLLEITHNAHSWTKWVHELIKQVREYAAIVRGDVTLPDGSKKVLRKDDWRKFIKDTDEKIVAWRQYSAHVKDLSISIIENFQGKKIVCCPKCLQDHLIKNVVVAHHTLRALTEAMNCAAYWRRCLDNMVDMTSQLTNTEAEDDDSETDSSETESDDGEPFVTSPDRTAGSCVCSTRLQGVKEESESDDSLYELEELDVKGSPTNPRRRS